MGQIELTENSRLWSRREVLPLALAPFALAIKGCLGSEPSEAEKSLQRIKAFEDRIGMRHPTLSEAQQHLQLIAGFFTQSTNSIQPPDEITRNTILVWNEPPYIDNPADSSQISEAMGSEWFNQLQRDNPHSDVKDSNVRSIISFYWRGSSSGFADVDQKIVIYNWELRERLQKLLVKGDEINQYYGFAPQTGCGPLRPIVELRSVLMHEMSHRETPEQPKPIGIELAQSFNGQFNLFDEVTAAKVHGFRLSIDGILKGKPLPYHADGLEEFFAMYVPFRIESNASLPSSLGPGPTPVDIFNFAQVLKQSNIDDQQLLKLHRNSALAELLMQIARSAKNVQSTPQQLLDFGIWFMGEIGNWDEIQPYFPAVDNRHYQYYGEVSGNQLRGCLNK